MQLSDQEVNLNLEIIKFLLEHGADRTLKSIDNQTAFDLAEHHQCSKRVCSLLKNTMQSFYYQKTRKPKEDSEEEDYLKEFDEMEENLGKIQKDLAPGDGRGNGQKL